MSEGWYLSSPILLWLMRRVTTVEAGPFVRAQEPRQARHGELFANAMTQADP
jgi:hypothetical protein